MNDVPTLATALEFGERFAPKVEVALRGLAASWPLPERLRGAAVAELAERVRAALEVPVDEVLAAGWRTFEGCRALCAQGPGESESIELAEHAVGWTLAPAVELVSDAGVRITDVGFSAEVEVGVKAGVLVVEGGRFVRLHAAALELAATLAVEGVPVAEWARPLPVPGTLAFGEGGIAICPEASAAPGAVGSAVRVPAIARE